MSYMDWLIVGLFSALALIFFIAVIYFSLDTFKKAAEQKKDGALSEEKTYSVKHGLKVFSISYGACLLVVLALLVPKMVFAKGYIEKDDHYSYVIRDSSMASVNEQNVYLSNNKIENQLYKNDVVRFKKTSEAPKVFDVVLYGNEGGLSISRITRIDGNGYILHDDAIASEKGEIALSEIKGIYEKRLGFTSEIMNIDSTPSIYIVLGSLTFSYLFYATFMGLTLKKSKKEKPIS